MDYHKLRMAEMDETLSYFKAEKDIFTKLFKDKYDVFDNSDFVSYCLKILEKRAKKKSLRAYFVRKMFEYIAYEQGKIADKRLYEQLGFVAEMVILIQYLHNQILDNKANISNTSGINANLLQSNLLREGLFDYIWTFLEPRVAKHTVNCVAKVLMYVDIGQWIDKEYNNYTAYCKQQSLNLETNSEISLFMNKHLATVEPIINEVKKQLPNKTIFIDVYFRRVFLTNSALFVCFTELIGKLYRINSTTLKKVTALATHYSLALQMVNDVADCVPEEYSIETIGKNASDAFSDLCNKNVTLLYAYHLQQQPKRSIAKILNVNENNELRKQVQNYQEQYILELLESNSIYKTIELGIKFAKQARNYLNITNPQSHYYIDILNIAYWNAYYYNIFKKISKLSNFP